VYVARVPTAARRQPGQLGRAVATILDLEVLAQGLTQQALGDLVGLSQTQIGSYLRGHKGMTVDEAGDICRALGLTLSEVIVSAEAESR
jgi:transcriptional regulator with XRE-family HTH domain